MDTPPGRIPNNGVNHKVMGDSSSECDKTSHQTGTLWIKLVNQVLKAKNHTELSYRIQLKEAGVYADHTLKQKFRHKISISGENIDIWHFLLEVLKPINKKK